MAVIVPAQIAKPIVDAPTEKFTFTATIDDADDLTVPSVLDATLFVTVTSAASDVATISDGFAAGQLLRVCVVNATNVLGFVIALTNMNNAADVDVALDTPATFMWDGTTWQVVAR